MSQEPLRRTPRKSLQRPDEADRPKIWAAGGQRPPFDLLALARASLWLARIGVAQVLGRAAWRLRRGAERVRDGAGRVPAERLGRVARFVPSHLRVAGWIKNGAAVLAHASANADPDVARGNALVAGIEPHLWEDEAASPAPPQTPSAAPFAVADPSPGNAGPVVLPEPMLPGADPLAAIRDEMAPSPKTGRGAHIADPQPPDGPALPPGPPGPLAVTAIQVAGYLMGWGMAHLALPYGLGRALWSYARGVDLRGIGPDD